MHGVAMRLLERAIMGDPRSRRRIVQSFRMPKVAEIPLTVGQLLNERGAHRSRSRSEVAIVFENENALQAVGRGFAQDFPMTLKAAASADAGPIADFARAGGGEKANARIVRVGADGPKCCSISRRRSVRSGKLTTTILGKPSSSSDEGASNNIARIPGVS